MVGRPQSQALRGQLATEEKNDLQKEALRQYRIELERELGDGKKHKGARKICQEVSDKHFAAKKRCVTLSHVTLLTHFKGGTTMSDFNQKKQLLAPEEEKAIVDYAVEMADRGFPLSPRRIREHANQILCRRMGAMLQEDGADADWATRFITQHHNRLGRYWSNPLDKSRARAVNPVTKEEFFQLLKDIRIKYNIPDALVYGADETGIQTGIGTAEYVVGAKGKGVQHQQRDGNRENITVLPTICVDGTNLAPAVIYKGEAFQSKWLQENPLDAR